MPVWPRSPTLPHRTYMRKLYACGTPRLRKGRCERLGRFRRAQLQQSAWRHPAVQSLPRQTLEHSPLVQSLCGTVYNGLLCPLAYLIKLVYTWRTRLSLDIVLPVATLLFDDYFRVSRVDTCRACYPDTLPSNIVHPCPPARRFMLWQTIVTMHYCSHPHPHPHHHPHSVCCTQTLRKSEPPRKRRITLQQQTTTLPRTTIFLPYTTTTAIEDGGSPFPAAAAATTPRAPTATPGRTGS